MSRRFKRLALGFLCVLSVAALPQTAPRATSPGIVLNNLDRAVVPGDDFYRFANGAWLQRTQMPPGRAEIGNGLNELVDRRVAAIVEDVVAANGAGGDNQRKIADLYASYMNEKAIEARGLAAFQPELRRIASIENRRQLARALGETLRSDVDPLNTGNSYTPNFLGFWLGPGFDDPGHYTAYLLQGGLELPVEEFYLSADPHMRDVRAKYQAHVARLLRLSGFTAPERRAARVVELERAMAEKHRSGADRDDIGSASHNWKKTDFSTRAPGLDWAEFFRAAGLNGQPVFTVWQPGGVAGEASLAGSAPLAAWKDWLAYHLLEDYGDALPKAMNEEGVAFFSETLNGAALLRSRAERAVQLVNMWLGDAVGEIYVRRHFSPPVKSQVQAMAAGIVEVYRKRIAGLAWMEPSTKREAIAKLDALYIGIGYPERWRDYSALEILPGDLLGNLRRARLFPYRQDVARLGAATDKHEWPLSPQTVNALNLPLQNAIVFSAALLQGFDPDAPAAANYGRIGALIGHEITHAFDPLGNKFDAQGRRRDWWTQADLNHYEEATRKLVAQFSQYRPFPDLALDGQRTLGENLADLAGVSIAYDAYRAATAGAAGLGRDGFTGDQVFFLAYAQNYASKRTEAALRMAILMDPTHSPPEYRADTVRNLDGWYSAFAVPATAKLYLAPAGRVRIW